MERGGGLLQQNGVEKEYKMLLKTKQVKVVGKLKDKRISSKGSEYTYTALYVKDLEGIMYTIAYVNDFIYQKAEENKDYILVYNLDTKGQLEINDIESVAK